MSILKIKRIAHGNFRVCSLNTKSFLSRPYSVIWLIKGPGINFQSSELNLRHVRLSRETLIFDQISFWYYVGFKRNNRNCKFYCVAVSMMVPQICKFIDFTKTQKRKYLENKTFFLKKKVNSLLYIKGHLMVKNNFLAEVAIKLSFCSIQYVDNLL